MAGVPVDVTLTQVQWTSVRRAEGNGFYTWDTQRREMPAGSWTVTTADTPVPLAIPFKEGGFYRLEARGRGDDGRFAVTRSSFYVLGDGYTAWQRFDHNRIELVPERQTYRPGDTARIMIQSPWEQATALVTTEREGIRSHRQFALTSTQQSIDVPITEDDIPNVFVSVLLVKGRTNPAPANASALAANADTSDPGKPSFRLGYVELRVEDRAKRLTVSVAADREEYRPAAKATVRVSVKDAGGAGTASEVTLWAVDYGVLSLTGYQPPDVSGSVYVRKSLQVFTADNRQRIVARRVLTPKGGSEGGGGGEGAGGMRRDFRVLAFWVGSVVTGADGEASVDVTLPESLTTYRIMAVAADRRSRFGSGSAEVRTNKPITLTSAFPRFLAVGDVGPLRRRGRQPAAGEWIGGGHDAVARPGGVRAAGTGRADGRGERRRHHRGAVLGDGAQHRPRPHPDDGANRRRERRVRRHAAGRGDGLAGIGGGLRRGGRRHDHGARDAGHADRRRARVRRPRRRVVVDGDGRPGRRRALPGRVSRTAASSRSRRHRWRWCSPPTSARRSRCPA